MTDFSSIHIFSYSLLEVETRIALEEAQRFIDARLAVHEEKRTQIARLTEEAHAELVAVGDKLLEMKQQFNGVFMQWRRACFGFSDDTAENLMNIARNLRQLPSGEITQSGAYEMAASSTPQDVRDMLAARARAGIKVDPDEVYIFNSAPTPVRERYEQGELPKKQAVALSKRLKTVEPTVYARALHLKVSHAAAVSFMHDTYRNKPKVWERLQKDDFHLVGVGVHLSEANERDVNQYKLLLEEEARNRAGSERDEKSTALKFGAIIDGDSLRVLQPGLLEAYDGRMVEVFVRIYDE